VEGVASRAGVGKATIYRRWASKLPLVVEAFGGLPALEDSDTGSVERDLKTMLRSYLELFHKTPLGTVVPSLPRARLQRRALKIFEPVMKGGRQPGAPSSARRAGRWRDLDLAADLVVGPIAVRLFFSGARLKPRSVDPIVELALRGILGRARGRSSSQ
jgi:AcrR family transcriptional regulator